MKYIINYAKEGKILGFVQGNTDLNIEVSNAIWFEAQGLNKIIIDGDNISFDKVDWRTVEEIEAERFKLIKAKAGEIIKSKYSIEWQLNHPRLDVSYSLQYEWIDNIRKISNEAESNGTALEDINWNI